MEEQKNTNKLLEVKDLRVSFFTPAGEVKAVGGISYDLNYGEVMGVVGESGSGKSQEAYSIIGLLQPPGKVIGGSITFEGQDVLSFSKEEMTAFRGNKVAMIFQNPMTCLNPVYTIGNQLVEALRAHDKQISKADAEKRAMEMMEMVGINNVEKRMKQYPHEFSGGMRQRAMIAMAMSCNPKVLIADEPTTALDVTIQAQIFELMDHLKKNYNTAIMMITHDMGVVCELADDVAVMYMGNIIESGSAEEVLDHPTHPYTKALLKSIPILGKGADQDINPIKGSTPDPYKRPPGCQFEPRCDYACEECKKAMPDEHMLEGTHMVRCTRYQEVMKDGK